MPISIITQPQDVHTTTGVNATFTLVAEGENLAYQWQRQGATSSYWADVGTNSSTLSVEGNAANDGAKYRCKVSDGTTEKISDSATLYVGEQYINVTTLREFLIAVRNAPDNACIICPKNAVWDWNATNAEFPEGLRIRCDIIGNDTEIWNFYGYLDCRTNSNSYDLKISKLHFLNAFFNGDYAGQDAAYGISTFIHGGQFLECKFSVQISEARTRYNASPPNPPTHIAFCTSSSLYRCNAYVLYQGGRTNLFDYRWYNNHETEYTAKASYCRFYVKALTANEFVFLWINPSWSSPRYPLALETCEFEMEMPEAVYFGMRNVQVKNSIVYGDFQSITTYTAGDTGFAMKDDIGNKNVFDYNAFRGIDLSGWTEYEKRWFVRDSETLKSTARLSELGFDIGEPSTGNDYDDEGNPLVCGWRDDFGRRITHTYFDKMMPDEPNASEILSVWKCNPDTNGGYPYIELFIGLEKLDVKAYQQHNYICVYGNRTPKTAFLTNGIAILTPTSCEVNEEYGGMWSVNMVHPYDEEGRWKLLQISNIIKVMGQLFTIKRVNEKWLGNTGSISVYAEHIFYQQNDGWIYPMLDDDDTPVKLIGTSGQHAIDMINIMTTYEPRAGSFTYGFDGHSDLGEFSPVWKKYLNYDGCTPIEALIGTDGIIEQKGGELYRDNFYYSINTRMENAKENAFDIRIGKNLTGIDRNIDLSNMVTYIRGYDDYGGWYAWAWDFGAFFGEIFPHYIVRSKHFDFPAGAEEDPDWNYNEWYSNTLSKEVDLFLKKNGKPIIGFTFEIEDVRNNPDFSIIADESLRVGDKGRVYDERLGGSIGIEISSTTYDALKEKCIRFTVGDRQSFVSTSMPNLLFDLEPIPVPAQTTVPVIDADNKYVLDASGAQVVEEV